MSDAPAFFRAIEANPDDDTPRLVYADWLDEHAASDADRARAEFIRVQCENARSVTDERGGELKALEQRLLAEFRAAWAAPWPTHLHFTTYARGFIDPVSVSSIFPRVAGRLAEFMPVHHVHLSRPSVVMKAIAACPQLALVRGLSMSYGGLRNLDMTALAASPHLGNLRSLDLSTNRIGIRGTSDLMAARTPLLRALRLADNPVKDRGLLAVAEAGQPSLEQLDVSRCELQPPGVIGLAESPLASRLTSLQLSGNPHVTTDAWLALARAPMGRLERLDLSNPAVGDEAVEALAANASLANLRVLHLGGATITDRGARSVLDSPNLRGLARLRLPERSLSPALRDQFRAAYGDGFNPVY